MKNNVYIVESPTQLMSAIEAKANNNGYSFLIVNYGGVERAENLKQIKTLVKSTCWDYIFEITQSSSTYINILLVFYFTVKFRMKLKPKLTRVYIGEYRYYFFQILAKVLSTRKPVLLDDGTVTIMLQKKYFSKGKGLKSYFRDSNKKTYYFILLYSYIFRFKLDDRPPDLYSIFNLDGWLVDKQCNDRPQSTPKEVEMLNEFYFFGAKYSEVGLFSLEVELLLLRFSFDYIKKNQNIPVNYVAHRDDSDKKISAIKNLGIEVRRLGEPCEIHFSKNSFAPKFIGGFYTTSLITLPSLFKIKEVISFNLSEYVKNKDIKDNIHSIYEYLKSHNVKVVDVDLIDPN
ncbi:hypothetical protein EU508_06380 [Pseudoalteromonas fuliginea]|uniref:Uncharacterized protein n=1 Tax=Pseudoalteromonas fuliginea TaxID=1872678 RepID=A0AB73BIK2_9GAMM|nr:hypothetical protein [Pseudoalteromonas fuliginea]KAA1162033.1 hypothetical protein EU508_06380 [Pseudoalteromonas fuliginea]